MRDDYVVVTSVNRNYLRIFDIWLHYFSRSESSHTLKVITFDRKSDRYVSSLGIESVYVGSDVTDPREIFVNRLEVIASLLEAGSHVIHTDADAIWVKPGIKALIDPAFDLQISIAYGIPKDVVKAWGFTLCCGFFVMHATRAAISFHGNWSAESLKVKDDQIALNRLLLGSGVEWNSNNINENQGFCAKHGLRIDAIRYDNVCRTHPEDPYVFHPYLPKRQQKLKVLDLIDRLRAFKPDPILDDLRFRTIADPLGWLSVPWDLLKMLAQETWKSARRRLYS